MRWAGAVLSLSLVAIPASGSAHHSIAAVYDRAKAVSITGTITRVEIVNPHSTIEVEVRRPNGATRVWKLESSGPGGMQRTGVTHDDLPIGATVKVVGYPARDGGPSVWLTRLQTPDRTFDFSYRRGPAPEPVPAS